MTIQITAVHMVSGRYHEHIASVKWVNLANRNTGTSTREEMVRFLTENPGQAIVSDGKNTVKVGVVEAAPKFIRTHADGKWTDNLLALPRF